MGTVDDRWWVTTVVNGKRVRRKADRFGKGKRYRARYRTPSGKEASESFPDGHKKAAEQFVAKMETDIAQGSFIDPSAGSVALTEFTDDWLASRGVDESTRESMESRLRLHFVPFFDGQTVGSVKPSHVSRWLKWLDNRLGAAAQAVLFAHVHALFQAAADDQLIRSNPLSAKSVSKPRPPAREVVPWTEVQAATAEQALLPRYRAMVPAGSGCGLRSGEIFGLSPFDVSRDREWLHVQRQVKIVRNQLVFAPPKRGKARRVPLALSVLERFDLHEWEFEPIGVTLPWLVPDGKPETVLLYFTTTAGNPIKRTEFMGKSFGWKRARDAITFLPGQDTGIHALRHLYASKLLDAGESIKTVAAYLGHQNPAFTLATYTHLMPASSGRSRHAIDGMWATPAARPQGGPAPQTQKVFAA